MNNKYIKNDRINEVKFRRVILYFPVDLAAAQISELTKGNIIKKRLAQKCEETTSLKGVIELDESYFGSQRQKEKEEEVLSKNYSIWHL